MSNPINKAGNDVGNDQPTKRIAVEQRGGKPPPGCLNCGGHSRNHRLLTEAMQFKVRINEAKEKIQQDDGDRQGNECKRPKFKKLCRSSHYRFVVIARLAFNRCCRAFSVGRRPPSRSKISTICAKFFGEEACEPCRRSFPPSISAQIHRCICEIRNRPGLPRFSIASTACVKSRQESRWRIGIHRGVMPPRGRFHCSTVK